MDPFCTGYLAILMILDKSVRIFFRFFINNGIQETVGLLQYMGSKWMPPVSMSLAFAQPAGKNGSVITGTAS